MLHAHLEVPAHSLEMMHLHMLPIDGDDFSPVDVTNSWNLEWKQRLTSLALHLLELSDVAAVLIALDEEVVWAELSVEATDDHDFVGRELAHTGSLSCGNLVCWILHGVDVDALPLVVEVGQGKLHSLEGS